MAETSGFFDAEELVGGGYDREYVAEQWANYFKLFISNGVFVTPTNQLKVVSNSGMTVTVMPGWAWINGYWYNNSANYTLTVPANTSAATKKHGIFVQFDAGERTIKLVVGNERTTVNRTSPYYELKLAEITVAPGVSAITTADITDTRGNSSVCGFVTGVVDVIDTGDLFAQFTAIFNNFLTASQTSRIEDEAAFNTWFNAMKDQLTTDAAGHLQTEIDDLEEALTGEVVDTEAYVLRQGLGNLADMALVGGSVAWNQLVSNGNFASTSGWSVGSNTTFTASNNIGKVVPIDSSNSNQRFIRQTKAIPVNHKVLVMLELSGNNECTIGFYSSSWQDAAILTFNITNNKATYSQIASLSKDSANVGLYFSNSTEVNISNFMCIDLTQLFGSTIADYIYSLEQATAGAGVAWFRKYFSNLYYGYQPGKIESVNVASRKVVGKNLLPFVSSTNTKSNVTMIINKDNVKISGKANGGGVLNIYYDVLPKEILAGNTYKITWGSAINAFQVITYDSNDTQTIVLNTASAESTGGNTIIIPSNAVKLQVRVALTANNSYDATLYPMIRLANVEDSTYEPYQEWTADFDPSIQLRGIPKLVDNKLSYDGDIYTADGTVTRKYGIFNLGDYTWGKETTSSGYRFYAAESTIKNTPGASVIPNAICSKYPTTTPELTWTASTKGVSVNITNHIIYIADSDYSDAEALKTSLSGVYLVAELATPTTESATPYQNPQRAFIDGTEEFIDAGVQSATRDVSIPVGIDARYYLSEVLPSSQDYTDGAVELINTVISALQGNISSINTAITALNAMYDGKAPSITNNLNTLLVVGGKKFSVYGFNSSTTTAPTTASGLVFTWSFDSYNGAQLVIAEDNVYYRKNNGGSMDSWQTIDFVTNLEQTKSLSTSTDTTYTFSSSMINANSVIDVYASIFGVTPSNVSVGSGSCTVTFPPYTSAASMKCRIAVRR